MLDNISVNTETAVAGTIGAAVSMAFLGGSLKYRATLFIGGVAASHYLTPYAAHYFKLSESGGSAFVIGIFAMSGAAAVIRALKEADFKTIFDQLSSWFGRK